MPPITPVPIAWLTTLGHSEEIFRDKNYLAHILGGVESAMGRQPFCVADP